VQSVTVIIARTRGFPRQPISPLIHAVAGERVEGMTLLYPEVCHPPAVPGLRLLTAL
jgi:hypothetical protein